MCVICAVKKRNREIASVERGGLILEKCSSVVPAWTRARCTSAHERAKPFLHRRRSSLSSDPHLRNASPLIPEWNLERNTAVKHDDSEPVVLRAQASEAALLLNNSSSPVLLVLRRAAVVGVGVGVRSIGSQGCCGFN